MATNIELIDGISASSKSITSKAAALKTQVTALEALKTSQAATIVTLQAEILTLKAQIVTLEARIAELEAGTTPPPPPTLTCPDAPTTGAKGVLVASGSITTTAAGQIIELKNVTGYIYVRHNNVIVRNCKVTRNADVCILVEADDCLVEDCTLIGGPNAGSRGVVFEGVTQTSANRGTVRRCNISGYEDGVVLGTGSYHKVMDNYFHHPIAYTASNDPHIDGIQLHGGSGNYSLIEHNNIDGYPEVSSSMTCGNRSFDDGVGEKQGAMGLVIRNNRMNGGTSVLYIEGMDSAGNQVTDNLMGNSIYGNYISGTGIGGAVYSGNKDINTGNPIL